MGSTICTPSNLTYSEDFAKAGESDYDLQINKFIKRRQLSYLRKWRELRIALPHRQLMKELKEFKNIVE